MPIASAWIDRLFGKLSLRYGAAFIGQWREAEEDFVKADWADVLDGLDGESIGFALRYLPSDRPPNAMQFRDICRRAPPPAIAALPAPVEPADPDRVRQAVAALTAGCHDDDMTLGQRCVENIRRIERERGHLSFAQQHQLLAIEGGAGSGFSVSQDAADKLRTGELKENSKRQVAEYAERHGIAL